MPSTVLAKSRSVRLSMTFSFWALWCYEPISIGNQRFWRGGSVSAEILGRTGRRHQRFLIGQWMPYDFVADSFSHKFCSRLFLRKVHFLTEKGYFAFLSPLDIIHCSYQTHLKACVWLPIREQYRKLLRYLAPFPSYGWLLVKIFANDGGALHFNAPASGDALQISNEFHLSRNYNDCPTWHWRPHDRIFIRSEKNTGTWVTDRWTDLL